MALLFADGFESGGLTAWSDTSQAPTGTPRLVATAGHGGPSAPRSGLRMYECHVYTGMTPIFSGERSDLIEGGFDPDEGDEHWQSLAVWIPTDWPGTVNSIEWHSNSGEGVEGQANLQMLGAPNPAAIDLGYDDSNVGWLFAINGGKPSIGGQQPSTNTLTGGAGGAPWTSKVYDLGPISGWAGQWVDVMLHVIWSRIGVGTVEVWMKPATSSSWTKYVDEVGTVSNLYASVSSGTLYSAYLKLPNYRNVGWDSGTEAWLWYDAVKVGTTQDDVNVGDPVTGGGGGGGSANAAKATVTDGIGSYLVKNFAEQDKIYVGIQFFLPTATEAAWLSGAFVDSPLPIWLRHSAGGFSSTPFVYFYDYDGNLVYEKLTGYDFDYDDPGATLAGTPHTLELYRDDANGDGPLTLKLDGVLLETVTFVGANTVDQIYAGAVQNHNLAPPEGDFYVYRIKVGTTEGASDLFDWDASSVSDLSDFDSIVGTVVLADAPVAPGPFGSGGAAPPGPGGGARKRFRGFPWRFIFSDLAHNVTTWAEGIQHERSIGLTLNSPAGIDGAVQSNDPRVNRLWTDGYPRIAQTIRMVHCFRREAPAGGPPWIIRAAGIIEEVQDEGGSDVALTHYNAFDPWSYLAARPVMDGSGELPDGQEGLFFPYTADVIAGAILSTTIAQEGPVHIDAGVDYGGTAFWGSTRPDGTHAVIETCDQINVTVQRGQTVAEIWNQLCSAGVCDIVLDPIWDPVNRPGYTHELSIYRMAGSWRPSAVFAWDRLNRNVSNVSRMHDAQPGSFFDKVQYFAGQGGFPVPATGPLVNAAAVSDFGSWWATQFFPSMTDTDPSGAAVLALAVQALLSAKQGKRTLTVTPITDRAPVALVAYGLGDRVPIYASSRLRVAAAGLQRVQAIPISVSDDDIENIGGVLCSPDYRDPS